MNVAPQAKEASPSNSGGVLEGVKDTLSASLANPGQPPSRSQANTPKTGPGQREESTQPTNGPPSTLPAQARKIGADQEAETSQTGAKIPGKTGKTGGRVPVAGPGQKMEGLGSGREEHQNEVGEDGPGAGVATASNEGPTPGNRHVAEARGRLSAATGWIEKHVPPGVPHTRGLLEDTAAFSLRVSFRYPQKYALVLTEVG